MQPSGTRIARDFHAAHSISGSSTDFAREGIAQRTRRPYPVAQAARLIRGSFPEGRAMRSRASVLVVLAVSAALPSIVARAQAPGTSTVPRPGPVETAPLPPPPGAAQVPAQPAPAPAPAAPPAAPTQAQPAPAPQPAAPPPAAPTLPPAAEAGALLAPGPSEPNAPQEVTVAPKPVAAISGQTTWDAGFATTRASIARLLTALKAAGVSPTGRPLVHFVEVDDTGFRYEAMIPVAAPPADRSALPAEVHFAVTPSGKAIRVVHKAAYEEIDGSFEALTVWLDAKGLEVRDSFVEEYVNDVTDPADAELEVNIYVFPR
jgi:effector-binding domain-containing protein